MRILLNKVWTNYPPFSADLGSELSSRNLMPRPGISASIEDKHKQLRAEICNKLRLKKKVIDDTFRDFGRLDIVGDHEAAELERLQAESRQVVWLLSLHPNL